MGANPRVVTEDVTFTWDGAPARLARGQHLDVAPGSALEAAIGPENLRPPGPIPAVAPEEQSTAAPRKPRAKAQDGSSDDGKDGDAS